MELRETEFIRPVHNDGVGSGNINPALEFGSADWTTGTTSVLRVGVDNLKIETLEVPEPGSIGLMIFGGFAVLLSRRIAR